MKDSEVLENVKTLLTDVGWCQRHMAINSSEYRVSPESEDAIAYCLIGALFNSEAKGTQFNNLENLLKSVSKSQSVVIFNDFSKTTKEDVLKVVDESIEILKNRGE